MSTEKKQKSGPGCLKLGFSVGCIAPILFIIGVIAVIVVIVMLASAGEDKATDDAIKRNNDRGSLETPIAASEWLLFEDGKVRATRLVRPADTMVEEFNMFNDESAEGADFVLVWFEVECGAEKCNPAIDLKLRLVDSTDKEWSEPLLMTLDDNLDHQEALRGATIAGWQVFEFPTAESIQAIWMKWDAETLYSVAPEAE